MIVEELKKVSTGIDLFSDLLVMPLFKENMARAGFIYPTPIQAAVMAPALAGRDILGIARTGSGKTLAFLLPMMEHLMHSRANGIEALVLVPTRELAMQIFDELKILGKDSGIQTALVVGGFSETKQLDAVRRGARLVIATPGRLGDYIKRRLVNMKNVRMVVLDEADRMVDMGFLPQMRMIVNAMSGKRQTMCFSATLDNSIAHLVHAYMENPYRAQIGSAAASTESVTLRIYEVIREQKLPLLIHLLTADTGTFLVFTRTKYGSDKVAAKLIQRGFMAAALHGNRSQSQRIKALEGFKSGAYRVLVATNIAARGIHVQSIAHVVNYDMPADAEDFIHRIGRTGRVEESGIATTFVMPEERGDIEMIERKLGKSIERLSLPEGLWQEPRSLHDEAADIQSRRAYHSRGLRHFGRRPRP